VPESLPEELSTTGGLVGFDCTIMFSGYCIQLKHSSKFWLQFLYIKNFNIHILLICTHLSRKVSFHCSIHASARSQKNASMKVA
jgi:hypothetical protein